MYRERGRSLWKGNERRKEREETVGEEMIRVRGSRKCCNRNAMRWKATFRAPFNVRGCAYVRVLSFKGRWVCYHYLATPKWFCYPFFYCRFIEDACWVWNDGFARKSIDFFFFFFWKWNVKFLRRIKTNPSNLSNRKDTFHIISSRVLREMEFAAFGRDECKWFRARIVITDKTKIEYDRSRCYWLHRPFTTYI